MTILDLCFLIHNLIGGWRGPGLVLNLFMGMYCWSESECPTRYCV